jgi:lipoprotein-anchoring transpeptidase ErfK/SrfK
MARSFRRCGLALLLGLIATNALAGTHQRHVRKRHVRPTPAIREAPLDPAQVNDPSTAPTLEPRAWGSAVLRAQILLARAHFSCGEIDARYGRNMGGAVHAFQESHGLAPDGVVREDVWALLNQDAAPALVSATIAAEDVAGPFTPIPEDMLEKAKLPALAYGSPLEALAEKYHASPKLLEKLNPGASFDQAGAEILVPNVATSPPGPAAKIAVSKSRSAVLAWDAEGRILASYPASSGSHHDPLPIGRWKIRGVAQNPVFHYNPDLFWDAREHEKAAVAPGPNNPVGVCWIDLSKPHYGIHGTPEPSQIGKTQSHGCIRLTNWDALELSRMVRPGTPADLEK